ncbi:MAG: hypothetical protein ACYC2H_11230 [Thermoplasmatota archaeon]
MQRRFDLAVAFGAISVILLLVSAILQASSSAADAACEADDACYVSGAAIGNAVLAGQALVAAAFVGLLGLAALAWVLIRRRAAS